MPDSMLYYEPKEDGYGRIFGSFDDVLLLTSWEEISYQKIDEKKIQLYGFCTSVEPVKKGSKVDGSFKIDESWSYSPQLLKIELHSAPWSDKRGDHVLPISEGFIANWILSNWKEGDVYKGMIEFNPGYEKLFERVNKSVLTGNLDESSLELFLDVIPVSNPTKITSKPSVFQGSGSGKGKQYKSKFEQVKEMFPETFNNCTTLEECAQTISRQYVTDSKRFVDSLFDAIAIKTCFGLDVPFRSPIGNDEAIAETIPIEPEQPLKQIDFSELIAQSNIEIKRLGWTNEEGKAILQERYNKSNRQVLTDNQLADFVEYLKKQPEDKDTDGLEF